MTGTPFAPDAPVPAARLIAYVGCYASGPGNDDGGIRVFDLDRAGALHLLNSVTEPQQAGYLAYSWATETLYAVDERKTDGRGPVAPAAQVVAFAADRDTGSLKHLNALLSPGPNPTYLGLSQSRQLLVSSNHGGFEHVEHVVRNTSGSWEVEYLYDDSTVVAYALTRDGQLGAITDVQILSGHGEDPNSSPQAGGHAQASPHAHCAVVDPTERFVLVCDKGCDRILVYALADVLTLTSELHFPAQTGPRHLAFDHATDRVFATLEFSSEIATLDFDSTAGTLTLLYRTSTVDAAFAGLNEPAEVRVHPQLPVVYVNNRGEDSLAWFGCNDAGELTRLGAVTLAESLHPGVAARSFAIDRSGSWLLLADRPANVIRCFALDAVHGEPRSVGAVPVSNPAFIAFAEPAWSPGPTEPQTA